MGALKNLVDVCGQTDPPGVEVGLHILLLPAQVSMGKFDWALLLTSPEPYQEKDSFVLTLL